MLNPFPIQFLAMLAYAILRFFVGGVLLYLGMTHMQHRTSFKVPVFIGWVSFFEIIFGIMFIAGFYTQYAALGGISLSILSLVFYKKIDSPYTPSRIFYVLFLGASLSLFITGAGAFAFDLPI